MEIFVNCNLMLGLVSLLLAFYLLLNFNLQSVKANRANHPLRNKAIDKIKYTECFKSY